MVHVSITAVVQHIEQHERPVDRTARNFCYAHTITCGMLTTNRRNERTQGPLHRVQGWRRRSRRS